MVLDTRLVVKWVYCMYSIHEYMSSHVRTWKYTYFSSANGLYFTGVDSLTYYDNNFVYV